MKPPPPASAFGGSVGKNAKLKEDSVVVTAGAAAGTAARGKMGRS